MVKVYFSASLTIKYNEYGGSDDEYSYSMWFDPDETHICVIPSSNCQNRFFTGLNHRQKYHPDIYFPDFVEITKSDCDSDGGEYSTFYHGYFDLAELMHYMGERYE